MADTITETFVVHINPFMAFVGLMEHHERYRLVNSGVNYINSILTTLLSFLLYCLQP